MTETISNCIFRLYKFFLYNSHILSAKGLNGVPHLHIFRRCCLGSLLTEV